MENQALLQKADLALSDLSTNGGLLNPEQTDTFIRKLIEPTGLLNRNMIRVVTMNAPTKKINKIGFGKRILRAGTQGTSLDTAAVDGAFNPVTEAAARAKPVTEQVELNTNEVIAEVHIPYDVMEDNIENATVATNEGHNDGPGGLRATILELIAERAQLDLEELGLLGDEALGAADTYLDLTDGWIKEAETNGNIYDAGGAAISKALFKEGVKTMPDKYLRDKASMRHFVSFNNEVDYLDTLADRGTAMGDGVLRNGSAAWAYGTPVSPVSLMPEAKGLLCNPMNLIFGIQRNVSMEFDKNIRTREYIIVMTARVDFQIEEAEATVAYNNIG